MRLYLWALYHVCGLEAPDKTPCPAPATPEQQAEAERVPDESADIKAMLGAPRALPDDEVGYRLIQN